MAELIRVMTWSGTEDCDSQTLLTREWLVSNGLSGYASSTLAGVLTRRYHGMLIAALPTPFGRRVMLSDVGEELQFGNGSKFAIGGEEPASDRLKLHASAYLSEFRLEQGLPVWIYRVQGVTVEKRLYMPYRQNTVYVSYSLVDGDQDVTLRLRPAMHFRGHEEPVSAELQVNWVTTVIGDRFDFCTPDHGLPPLRMLLYGRESAFTHDRRCIEHVIYRSEESRGYDYRGSLWSPGYFHGCLHAGEQLTLVASTESWETIRALDPASALAAERTRRQRLLEIAHVRAREGPAAELVLAADQFIMTPAGRVEDTARAHASGDEIRSVVAGYHWFTDWGRDTMISLEGLTLCTGRTREAGWILRTFSYYIRDGLIPNMFPEGEKQGLYHTADATLWFFHALHRYLGYTGDRITLRLLLPELLDCVEQHLNGTLFNIHVDPGDGLLCQGAEGYQLTWMDAKVGDWVVTPRRGKAVEINALWYNALCILTQWLEQEENPRDALRIAGHAARARESFNRRFWYERGGYLYDVVDGENGDDHSLRPNQIFSISLDHPILDRGRWERVMQVTEDRLLTPFGLRSLAPGERDYKPRYFGDLRSRDAAYHQGTVWAWLIGPFIDAWLKLHPGECAAAGKFLESFVPVLGESCIGSINEIFDADAPYTPRGCVAQAWSVAEVLRCWLKTSDPDNCDSV